MRGDKFSTIIMNFLLHYEADGETVGAISVSGWEDISAIKMLTVGSRGSRIGSRRPIEAMDA